MIERFNLLDGEIYRKLPKSLFLDDYLWETRIWWSRYKGAANI
jgi:S-adenosylmethionine synthetase